MNDAAPVRPRPARGILFVLIGAVLAAAVVLFISRLDAFIDSVRFYVDISVLAPVLGVVGLIGIFAWIHGHRVLARSKGYSSLLGLVLGFLVGLGFVVLLALPTRPGAAAPADPEPMTEPAAEPE